MIRLKDGTELQVQQVEDVVAAQSISFEGRRIGDTEGHRIVLADNGRRYALFDGGDVTEVVVNDSWGTAEVVGQWREK